MGAGLPGSTVPRQKLPLPGKTVPGALPSSAFCNSRGNAPCVSLSAISDSIGPTGPYRRHRSDRRCRRVQAGRAGVSGGSYHCPVSGIAHRSSCSQSKSVRPRATHPALVSRQNRSRAPKTRWRRVCCSTVKSSHRAMLCGCDFGPRTLKSLLHALRKLLARHVQAPCGGGCLYSFVNPV